MCNIKFDLELFTELFCTEEDVAVLSVLDKLMQTKGCKHMMEAKLLQYHLNLTAQTGMPDPNMSTTYRINWNTSTHGVQ